MNERFARYLDGLMTDDEARAFEEALDRDGALADAFEAFAERQLPAVPEAELAPLAEEEFVSRVKTRLRRRSQGRFYAEEARPRSLTLGLSLFVTFSLLLLLALFFADLDRFFPSVPAEVEHTEVERSDEGDAPEGQTGSQTPAEVPRSPEAPRSPEEQLEQGQPLSVAPQSAPTRVSGGPVLELRRLGRGVIVRTEVPEAELRARLVELFGEERLHEQEGGSWHVRVGRTELPEAIQRMSHLDAEIEFEERELTVDELDHPRLHVHPRR